MLKFVKIQEQEGYEGAGWPKKGKCKEIDAKYKKTDGPEVDRPSDASSLTIRILMTIR